MKVSDILSNKDRTNVITILPEQVMADVVRSMCEHGIGALMVVDAKGNPVGIVTERDVLRCANGHTSSFGERRVRDVMSAELICGLPDDEIDYVMQVMTQNRIRHLPIVQRDRVVGMISIGDVIKSQLQATRVENHMLKDYLHLRGEI